MPLDVRSDCFCRDLEYEGQPGVADCLHAVRSGYPIIFVSGKAGTGKSRLISYLSNIGSGRQLVVAPTGIAALGIGASTIHSTLKIPFRSTYDAREEQPGMDKSTICLLRNINRLVIDEISMVRADLLDMVDARLQYARNSPLPFGGVQLVMVGDFLQLPPVTPEAARRSLSAMGYETPWALSAKVLTLRKPVTVELSKVYRQNDPMFIEALSRVRDGSACSRVIDYLNGVCYGPHSGAGRPLVLVSRRKDAEEGNRRAMEALIATPARPHWAIDHPELSGTLSREQNKNDATASLHIAVGCRVMATRNDPDGRFANGSLGTVTSFDFDAGQVFVRFDGSSGETEVNRIVWEDRRHTWNERLGEVQKIISGRAVGFPLTAGSAITIHKSQGLSLDNVRVDVGSGIFDAGQLYVALSRARTIQGLSLEKRIRLRDVIVDPGALEMSKASPV